MCLNKAYVIIRGKKFPVVGRVTMDQILVDVGTDSPVARWDTASLIGRSGAIRVEAEDLAALIGTIAYEITCGIHPRVPRLYI